MKFNIENKETRNKLYHHLQMHLDRTSQDDSQMAILLIKIQALNYLEVNLGFDTLELISRRIQARLLSCIKNADFVTCTSLDSFIMILPNMLNKGHIQMVADRVLREIKVELKIEQEVIELDPLIGIATASDSNCNGASIYHNALIALDNGYENKVACTLFQPEFKMALKKLWNLKKDLEIAIYENQFELYFQPKIDLNKMQVCGAEALIRWNHPTQGMISPNDFIMVAETSGQIQAITEWVIKSAFKHLERILKINPQFTLSINISANNLNSTELGILIEDTLSIWSIPEGNIIVEVTESTIMTDSILSLHQLEKIRALGVGISIDDFGTGYSSLSYFKKIPATELKIDKSFVDNLLANPDDRHIVSLIIFLAKRFNLKVVAEGIETKEVLDEICSLKCDYAQGFYFSKPLCFSEFIEWVANFKSSKFI